MKKVLVLVFFACYIFSSAQTVTCHDLREQWSAKDLTGQKGGVDITVFETSDGVTSKMGSTITYGYPPSWKYYPCFKDVIGSWINSLTDDGETSAGRAANQEIAERVGNCDGALHCTNFAKAIAVGEVQTKMKSSDAAL